MKEISYEQLELFPSIPGTDTDRTQILLEKFCFMKDFITEFEENGELLYLADIEGEKARKVFQDETHADKTPNAVVLHDIRKWKYNEFKLAVTGIEMGYRMIRDSEVKDAIRIRYFEDMKPMRAAREMRMDKNTFKRRIAAGIEAIGDTLKLMNILDRNWTF
ncbi:hypothetical protein ACFCP7_22935 [Paenibacillus elgii]